MNRKKLELVEQGKPKLFLIPKARRMGITTGESVKGFYRWRVFTGQYISTVAHRKDDVEAVFDDQVLRWYGHLPSWFKPDLRRSSKRELVSRANGSRFSVESAGSTGGGRGGTFQRYHITEAAYALKQTDLENQMAGYTEAASHGDVTVESTGNGPGGWFYEECMDALRGHSAWSMIFCPWYLMHEYSDPVPDGVTVVPGVPHCDEAVGYVDDEAGVIARASKDWSILLTPGQLLWRRRMRRKLRKNRKFYQEYPEQIHDCFQASAKLFYAVDAIMRGRARCKDVIHSEYADDWSWKVWVDPGEGKHYVAAMDVAEGTEGGDWTYLSIHERETMEQVAAWHGHIRPKEAAGLGMAKCEHYNQAVFAPERNNHGHTVVAASEYYGGLYWHQDDKAGWLTNKQTRPQMLDSLADALEEWDPPIQINDEAAYDEMLGFQQTASGKYEGSPDDRVITLGIALEVRQRSAPPRLWNLANIPDEPNTEERHEAA